VPPLLAAVTALGADQQPARGQLGSALHIAVAGGSRGNLEGEQSPWEERAKRRWKRRRIATDSSVEKRPEVGASSGAVLTVPSGNGRCGRCQGDPSACATRSSGLARTATVTCRFHQVTHPRFGGGGSAPSLGGRLRTTTATMARTVSASLLTGCVPGAFERATSVARRTARGDVEGRFGGFEHHRAEARAFVPSAHFGVAVRCSPRPRSERVLGSPPACRRVSSSSGFGRGSVRFPLSSLRRWQAATPASVGAAERAPAHFGVRVLAGPGVSPEPGLGRGGRRPTARGKGPQ
jgi:hypothetical protein